MVLELLFSFAFFYPVAMSFFWVVGGLYYYLRREHSAPPRDQPPPLADSPMVSILVPCHNEAANIGETIGSLLAQRYPNFEIIAVNDGSDDDTGTKLDALAEQHPQVRAIHLDRNLGKANALRMGSLAARSEYLVCIDGDALLDPHACHWMA